MHNNYLKKKILNAFTAGVFLLSYLFASPLTAMAEEVPREPSASQEASWPQGPSIMGESGIVMEVSTGTILYEKNMHDQHYPASITKIMTVLLAIEKCGLDEIVTVPHEAVYMEDKGSHIALDEGEQLTVEQCLYAVMLASANDAAYSLAIHIGGTIEEFAAMMNLRAQQLGCEDTNFTNPHGLPDEEHLTSAYDMALITKQALQYEIFRTVAGTMYYEIPATEHQKDLIPMSQHNKMLGNGKYGYEGAFCGKTGYTVAARNTLVTCASKDGMELICVTMKTEGKQVYVDTATLFDFGFENFKLEEVAAGEDAQVKARIEEKCCMEFVKNNAQLAAKINVVLPDGSDTAALQMDISEVETLEGGQRAAQLRYLYQGYSVGSSLLTWTETPEPAAPLIPEPEPEGDGSQAQNDHGANPAVIIICLFLAAGAGGFLYYYKLLQKRRMSRRKRNYPRMES